MSRNQNLFNSIRVKKPKKNVFDLSHDVKLSLDMGNLYPILAMECVPGDSIRIGCEALLRFAPLIAPVMHRMHVSTHTFFVPNRILWNGWEDWITNPQSTRVHPVISYGGDMNESVYKLADYLGLPRPSSGVEYNVSALPFLAYQCIYNEYYRDQNLIAPLYPPGQSGDVPDGVQTSAIPIMTLRKRAWTHDYFTAALPWAQKGAIVDIPLGTATVRLNPAMQGTPAKFVQQDDYNASNIGDLTQDAISVGVLQPTIERAVYDPNGTLSADFDPTSINSLRRAFKLQEWLEKAARGGTRLYEMIYSMFGVRSEDSRLQRPEYVGGTHTPVMVSEVLNTSGAFDPTDPTAPASRPQGDMAGHGISRVSGKYSTYYAKEHGYLMTILSVLPQPAYQQGVARHFLKFSDMFDHYWPDLAHIGEQEVKQMELYADNLDPADGEATFGYVPRYSEYKYMPSRVCGDFRNTLNFWHLGRIFDTPPALNQAFVECVPSKRIFAVVDEEQDALWAHCYLNIRAVRPMPKFGTPSF